MVWSKSALHANFENFGMDTYVRGTREGVGVSGMIKNESGNSASFLEHSWENYLIRNRQVNEPGAPWCCHKTPKTMHMD